MDETMEALGQTNGEQPEVAEADSPATDDEVAEAVEDDPEPEPEPEDGPEDEPEVAEAEIGNDELTGDNGLFDDVEDADDDDGGDEGDPLGELEEQAGGLSSTINEGAARMAVVGLDDADDLEDEMADVFRAFQLGHFGGRFLDEYVMADGAEEIHPAWGLFGSALCCAAVALWMRPDSEEQVEKLSSVISNISGA